MQLGLVQGQGVDSGAGGSDVDVFVPLDHKRCWTKTPWQSKHLLSWFSLFTPPPTKSMIFLRLTNCENRESSSTSLSFPYPRPSPSIVGSMFKTSHISHCTPFLCAVQVQATIFYLLICSSLLWHFLYLGHSSLDPSIQVFVLLAFPGHTLLSSYLLVTTQILSFTSLIAFHIM